MSARARLTRPWLPRTAASHADLLRSRAVLPFAAVFALMLCYVGGENVLVNRWQSEEYRLPVGYLTMTCCLRDAELDAKFLRLLRQGVIQFVIVKIVLTLVMLGLGIAGLYDEGHYKLTRGYLYVVVLKNASIFVALYALVVFYLATKTYLKPYNPILKFGLVKGKALAWHTRTHAPPSIQSAILSPAIPHAHPHIPSHLSLSLLSDAPAHCSDCVCDLLASGGGIGIVFLRCFRAHR